MKKSILVLAVAVGMFLTGGQGLHLAAQTSSPTNAPVVPPGGNPTLVYPANPGTGAAAPKPPGTNETNKSTDSGKSQAVTDSKVKPITPQGPGTVNPGPPLPNKPGASNSEPIRPNIIKPNTTNPKTTNPNKVSPSRPSPAPGSTKTNSKVPTVTPNTVSPNSNPNGNRPNK